MPTVKEARSMWCPMVRQPVETHEQCRDNLPSTAACNTDSNQSRTTNCSGNRCMMWRWSEPWREARDEPMEDKRQGFCGLAGFSAHKVGP